ncbi:MAG: LysE family translocator [Alphaproteobacteria bacterium]|nr:LysE family translocator [Alphaproteobacteria bacterium]
MSYDLILALAGFAFVSSITPGPNNLMLMTSGANFGFARTIPHLLGVSIGFTAMIVIVGAGLAQAFSAVPELHTVLKVVSAAYLLYLAWKIAKAPPPNAEGAARATPLTFLQAAAFQWVNPKAWTMALTALSVYAPTTDAGIPVMTLLIIAVVFGAINLPSVGVWTAIGTQLRRVLSSPGSFRVFNGVMAALLVASLIPVVFSGAH